MSSSIFNEESTEVFVVQIAGNPSEGKVFACQQILEILSIGFLVRQVIDSDVGSFSGKGNDCCSTDARVTACDEYVEALEPPISGVAVLATVGRDGEIGLEDREARCGQCYFMLREAIDGVDQLNSLYKC